MEFIIQKISSFLFLNYVFSLGLIFDCNRTFHGQVGIKYPLRLTEPFQRFQPFICKMTFTAAGGEFGDIAEITFLSFQIGSFEVAKNQSAGCYSGHIIIEEQSNSHQTQTDGYAIALNQQNDSYSTIMSTFKRENGQKQLSNNGHKTGEGDELETGTVIMSSPHSLPIKFGRFCGQMSVRSATYYSESNNVSLLIYVPSRASVLTYSFSLYLTYKFLPSWPSVTRFGPNSNPFELGIKLPNTYCDRVFEDCSVSNSKCKIRSPNWPGFYNRNITCKFWIRHYPPVPNGYKAHIVISQHNEYKISLFSGSSSSSDHFSSSSLQSECPLDVVSIYDGQTTQSPVLIEFCGSGVLPEIVTSRPEVLVVLKSAPNQILYNSRLELDVGIKMEKIDDTSNAVLRTGVCDFIYDSTKIRSGVIETPKHSIPSNTTCTFKFVSPNTYDRIWLYFTSYFVQDKHHWSNQELCDVSRLEIYDYVLMPPKTNDTTTTSLNYQQKQRLYSYCEKTSPKICGRAADANNYLPLIPCTYPNESYLSGGSELVIKQEYYKYYDIYVRRASFAARFEFIDTYQHGNAIDTTLCDRQITSFGRNIKGKLNSPKNLFFYGRGGRENVSCSYHFNGTAKQRIRIIFDTIHLQSLSCEQLFDPQTNQYQCHIIDNSPNKRKKRAVLTLYDRIESESIAVACLCNIVTPRADSLDAENHKSLPKIMFDMISSNAIFNFSFTRMSPFEDFNDYRFEASFEFLPAFDCDSAELLHRRNGSEGEIQYSVPHSYDFERQGPLKCRWIITATLGKHLYIKFKGFLANSRSAECSNGNRFVVYAENPRRAIATVCANKAKTSFNANSVSSELEEFDLFSLSWYNDSDNISTDYSNDNNYTNYFQAKIFIEIMAYEFGTFHLRWLEVTKPFLKSQVTGKTMRNINCLVECPELNACISPELFCDGISHCPSAFDENPEYCNKFPTLYVISIGSLIILCFVIIILVIAIYRFQRQRRLRQSNCKSNNTRYNQRDSDYHDYPEYPRLGSELNFRSIYESHDVHDVPDIQYQEGMPMEITRSFVPQYHNNVF